MTEARGIEHARHAADFLMGQARKFTQRPNHRVQRVGDADHKGVWRVLGNALAHGLHDLQVDAQQVITAHAGLARHTSGHDADIRASNIGIILGAGQGRVELARRARFRDVECFAFWNALCDVEQNNVAKFLQGCKMRQRAADLSRTDQRNFGSGHRYISECWCLR